MNALIDNEIQELEKRIDYLKSTKSRIEYAKSVIHIGVLIRDKDSGQLAKVDGMKNGCIDFSAKYLDGSYSRGYHFTVDNWEVVG